MPQNVVNELLQYAILIYGMTVGSTAEWNIKNHEQPNVLLYSDLNTNYFDKWPATATHTPGHVINVPSHYFLLLSYSYYAS